MSFDGLLINTVTHVDQTFDILGDPSETLTVGVKCRIMDIQERITNFKGEEVTSAAKLFYKPGQAIAFTTKIRISGDPYDHPIEKINKPQDSNNLHHAEVWIS